MASQRCPKCKSRRVRQGYRPTSTLLKFLFRYHLLCDECNWEFTGFAIPGTVAKKTRKRKNNNNGNTVNDDNFKETEDNLISEILANRRAIEKAPENNHKRKKIKQADSNQPSLIEEILQEKVENQADETVKSNEPSLKRQRVKKKVRVKFH